MGKSISLIALRRKWDSQTNIGFVFSNLITSIITQICDFWDWYKTVYPEIEVQNCKVFLPFLLWHLAMGQKTHHIRELTRRTCTRYQEREGLRLHFSIGYIRKCLLEIGHLHLLWRILCLVVRHYKTINQFCNNEYQHLQKNINGDLPIYLYSIFKNENLIPSIRKGYKVHSNYLIITKKRLGYILQLCTAWMSIRCHYYSIHQCF